MKFFDEFKEFISRGNVMDMAVGVVVGGAFTSIVNSLVKDIITPAIALVTKLFKTSVETGADKAGVGDTVNKLMDMQNWIIPGTAINIGSFLQSVISFLIMAFIIFCVVKGINVLRDKTLASKEEENEQEEEKGPTQEELLAEIRDLLKKDK